MVTFDESHPDFQKCAPVLLDHLNKPHILGRFQKADGRELRSKFLSERSSSALAANAFGLFCDRPELFCLPATLGRVEQCISFEVEERLRFPWSGGKHPNLDCVAITASGLTGIECKRFEPFDLKKRPKFSDAYWRDQWGQQMARFQQVRDDLHSGRYLPRHLDARQLIAHALGILTQARKKGVRPHLLYVHLDEIPIAVLSAAVQSAHKREIDEFAARVCGDEVTFGSITYGELLKHWSGSRNTALSQHARAVQERFCIQ